MYNDLNRSPLLSKHNCGYMICDYLFGHVFYHSESQSRFYIHLFCDYCGEKSDLPPSVRL